MLTVVITSIPASSSSSTSCQRFALPAPGTFVWASSSTRATSGRRASTAVDVHLGEGRAAVHDRPAGHHLQALDHLRGVRPAVGLDEADDDVGAAVEAPMALAEHVEGLADARGGPEVDPQGAAALRGAAASARDAGCRGGRHTLQSVGHVTPASRRGPG